MITVNNSLLLAINIDISIALCSSTILTQSNTSKNAKFVIASTLIHTTFTIIKRSRIIVVANINLLAFYHAQVTGNYFSGVFRIGNF